MGTIRLPRVAVSRELAKILVQEVHPDDEVVIDGRGLVVNNESFAFQLASDLVGKSPRKVKVLGGSTKWQADLKEAASELHLKVETQSLLSA